MTAFVTKKAARPVSGSATWAYEFKFVTALIAEFGPFSILKLAFGAFHPFSPGKLGFSFFTELNLSGKKYQEIQLSGRIERMINSKKSG
jgi:hypothetical protein